MSASARTCSAKLASTTLPIPPVSTTVNGCFPKHDSATRRSRVTPAWSCTMDIFFPTRRLKSADLPTLGRPTMATVRLCGMASGLELANSGHHISDARNQREKTGERHRNIEEIHVHTLSGEGNCAVKKIELEQHTRNCSHLQRRGRLAHPTRLDVHFADEKMQHARAD